MGELVGALDPHALSTTHALPSPACSFLLQDRLCFRSIVFGSSVKWLSVLDT
jgi:hypothetical protein